MRSWLIMGIAFLLIGCIAWADNKPETPPLEVTYCQLAKDPSVWSGKRIRVRAIYRYTFEFQRLEAPVCCPHRGPKIWVEFGANLDPRSERLFRKIDGTGIALVVFAGKFEAGEAYGPMGERFRLTVDDIVKIENTAKATKDQRYPKWVPKDCGESAERALEHGGKRN